MGEIKIVLPNELEHLFRKAAMKRFGYQKGAISKAAVHAIKSWHYLSEGEKKSRSELSSFRGIISNVKKGSVELKHEAFNHLINKHVHR